MEERAQNIFAIEEIVKIYKQFPSLRFGQFLNNVREICGASDLFYMSNTELLEHCKAYARIVYNS